MKPNILDDLEITASGTQIPVFFITSNSSSTETIVKLHKPHVSTKQNHLTHSSQICLRDTTHLIEQDHDETYDSLLKSQPSYTVSDHPRNPKHLHVQKYQALHLIPAIKNKEHRCLPCVIPEWQ
jgi:hypothetical protein